MKPINMFDTAALERQKEQSRIENELRNKSEPIQELVPEPAKGSSEDRPASNRKAHMNINLPLDYKKRLQAAAAKQHTSASYLILSWIDEHCD